MIEIYGEILKAFFEKEKIEYYSCIPLDKCKILYERKLPAFTQSVCFFLIPYYVSDTEKNNVSLYAVPRDYHLYVQELQSRLEILLGEVNAKLEVRIFADNSPFAERTCAEAAELGRIGKNGLLINPQYGSFTFIGNICLSHNISITQRKQNFNSDICGNCEKCLSACPERSGKCGECLSNITQKKRITDEEADIISKSSLKWGCDICQTVCPYNRSISETPVEFFKKLRKPHLTKELLDSMSESDFADRAYSWRGRSVIERNLGL